MATILCISSFYWYFVDPVRTIEIYVSGVPSFITFAAFASFLCWFAVNRCGAEPVLREQAHLLNLTHDAVLSTVIRYWNRGAEERYRWTAAQAVGRVDDELLKTVLPAPIEEIRSEVTRTGRWEGELVHTREDGSQVMVASVGLWSGTNEGAGAGMLETNNDNQPEAGTRGAPACELRTASPHGLQAGSPARHRRTELT